MKLLFYPSHAIKNTRIKLALDRMPDIGVVMGEPFDVAIHWRHVKNKNNSVYDPDPMLDHWHDRGKTILNYRLHNISKKFVDECMTEVLGYSSLVPEDYVGVCITKRNQQSTGDVKVIQYPDNSATGYNAPFYKYDHDYRIHQKIIDTSIDGVCVEYRVFIFGDKSFVLEKKKPVGERYKSNARQYKFYETADIFSEEQIQWIQKFCNIAGLDIGEIDVLFGKDGYMYIVDINNIAGGGSFFLEIQNGLAINQYIKHLRQLLCK